jgi:hypothetical protein
MTIPVFKKPGKKYDDSIFKKTWEKYDDSSF